MKQQDVKIFFDRKAASGFDDLFDVLIQLHQLYKEEGKSVKWNQNQDLSVYGLRLVSKSGKFSLFIGMYWHFWSDLGFPISISLESTTGVITEEDNSKFKKNCESIIGLNSKYFNYDSLNICGLSIDFLCQDIQSIKLQVYDLFLNLQLNNK